MPSGVYAQMIFQVPYTSLDPRITVRETIAEPLEVHRLAEPKEIDTRVRELIYLVGLDISHLAQLLAGLSGGQRQRVGIARANRDRSPSSSLPTSRSPHSTCRSRRRS